MRIYTTIAPCPSCHQMHDFYVETIGCPGSLDAFVFTCPTNSLTTVFAQEVAWVSGRIEENGVKLKKA
jgi:hypothetical protein